MQADIEEYDGNKLLNTPEDDLAAYFSEQYEFVELALKEDAITADQTETMIPIDRIRDGRFLYSDGARQVKGTKFSYFVPFEGHAELFRLRPNSYSLNPPKGTVRGSELVLNFVTHQPDAAQIKAEFGSQLQQIRTLIRSVNSAVIDANKRLRPRAQQAIQQRRQALLTAQNTVSDLGFPLRRRTDAVRTFAPPAVRRNVKPAPPAASSEVYKPEPALPTEEYEHILSVIENMAVVLERSPSSFRTMGEEDLRQHFLVQLNGHYEGTATGETFNAAGKTDILIRHEGKNLFIAECKFWKGPKKFQEAIDQLLSYTCWRDTKTAIVLFNRDTALSTVLSKIPDELRSHACFKRHLAVAGETRFRVVMHRPSDPSRELIVTVQVFDVPGAEK
ncbi:MAG: hypothetical protein H6707_03835 [Deltaproteobacteria bacterium]|nr:hypothetical protein [Deltaproteobacteria bacterium]